MNEEWIFVGGFAAKVLEYVRLEWGMELSQFSRQHQEWALMLVSDLKGRESVPNIAAKVAEALPL